MHTSAKVFFLGLLWEHSYNDQSVHTWLTNLVSQGYVIFCENWKLHHNYDMQMIAESQSKTQWQLKLNTNNWWASVDVFHHKNSPFVWFQAP